jgi:hypothetical protein
MPKGPTKKPKEQVQKPLSVGAHFHQLIRGRRGEIRQIVSKADSLKKSLSQMEKSFAEIKDKPVWRRKALDLERTIVKVKESIERLEDGSFEQDFENVVAPFSHEFMRRRNEQEIAKRKRDKELFDHVPQVKRRKMAFEGASTKEKAKQGIVTIGTADEDDPEVIMDELRVELNDPFSKLYMNPHDVCEDCDVPMEIAVSHPMLVCPSCHKSRPFLDVTSASMGFGRNVEFNRFNYERRCHLSDKLSKVQAKKYVDISLDKYEAIMTRLAQKRISPEDVTIPKVYEIVRELKFRNCYTAIPQIYSHLLNKPVTLFSDSQKFKLHNMFRAVQEPYERVEKTRKNFVAYNYCMHKLVQLLGLDYFTEHFPLLKGDKNLKSHDSIWQSVCKDLDWEFVTSN